MKKLCAALLALCLLLAGSMTALAAETETIDILVETVQAEAGAEQATVAVTLSGCAKMDSIQLRLNYDQTCMRLAAVETEGLLDSGLHVLNTETSGLLILAFASAEGLRQEQGTLLRLTFTLANEAGSALTVSEALATRYDKDSGVQSKAYVTVQDGGVTFAADGALPDAVSTPWIAETPAPTPEPTPEPTEIPMATPEPAAAASEPAAEKKTGGVPMILPLLGGAALLLFGAAAGLIVKDRKKKREAERKKAERIAAKRAAARAAQRKERAAAGRIADGEDIEEIRPRAKDEPDR